jgi:AraC family transcriptional regulator, transcriptional activator of pobA
MLNKQIPLYKTFNQSLAHLHLPISKPDAAFHVFKWQYTENKPIDYPLARQAYFDITFFVSAKFTHNINTEHFPIINHSLHILTPGQTEWFQTQTMDRPAGFGIYFKPEFLFGYIPQQQLEADLPFLKDGNRNTFYFTPNQSAQLQKICKAMLAESENNADGYALVRQYLLLLLYKIKQFHKHDVVAQKQAVSKAATVTSIFKTLLKSNFTKQTNMAFYAKQLAITPSQLNAYVQKETGKTPKQLLLQTILLEAKLMLQHSDKNISEIANQFNFHDLSHFVNFFTKATGLTPQQFRKKVK